MGCCKCGDELAGSGNMEFVSYCKVVQPVRGSVLYRHVGITWTDCIW
jgi:hypothetical protein